MAVRDVHPGRQQKQPGTVRLRHWPVYMGR